MTPLLLVYPLILIGVIILVGVLFYFYGFQRAVRYLFLYGLLVTILGTLILLILFPELNQGLGIGFLVVVVSAPIFGLLGLINLGVFIFNYFKRKTNTVITN